MNLKRMKATHHRNVQRHGVGSLGAENPQTFGENNIILNTECNHLECVRLEHRPPRTPQARKGMNLSLNDETTVSLEGWWNCIIVLSEDRI